jgi:hypothetical protein
MGVHFSVISIEGSHLDRIGDLLLALNYRLVGPPVSCGTGSEASSLLDQDTGNGDVVRKAAYETGGWTHLLDPELVVMQSEEQLAAFAQAHSTRILAWVCESFSASYGFRLFAPTLGREVLAVGGNVLTNDGDALSEEQGIDWAHAGEREVLGLAKRVGAEYDWMTADATYLIYTLDESHLPAPDLTDAPDQLPFSPNDIVARVVGHQKRRPWWKFW